MHRCAEIHRAVAGGGGVGVGKSLGQLGRVTKPVIPVLRRLKQDFEFDVTIHCIFEILSL